MKTRIIVLIIGILFLAGCSSTKNDHGVIIEKKRSFNPLDIFN